MGFQEDAVSLLINSPAQMITEKLKSMVRFGIRNTRYKDVYDICYLSERVNMDQLKDCIHKYEVQTNEAHYNLVGNRTLEDIKSKLTKREAL